LTVPSYAYGLTGATLPSLGATADIAANAGTSAPRDLALSTFAGAGSGRDWGLVRGVDAIAQAVQLRLNFFAAEWVLDTSLGIDFFGKVLVKNPNPATVKSIFTAEALKCKGVAGVESFSFTVDPHTRRGEIKLTIKTDTGQLVELVVPIAR
jgi:hypothetical protein